MKKKTIITMMLALVTMAGCIDKGGADFEVSLEGQLVKTDVNKGKWPKWMLGDNIYAIDHDMSIYSSKLTSTEWQKAEKVFVHGHGQNEFGDVVLSKDDDGALKDLSEEFNKSMSHAVNDSIRKYPGTTDAEKKANILRDLCNKYDKVVFVDDDDKNIKASRGLGLKNLMVVKAQE
jgi:hypothetical protein